MKASLDMTNGPGVVTTRAVPSHALTVQARSITDEHHRNTQARPDAEAEPAARRDPAPARHGRPARPVLRPQAGDPVDCRVPAGNHPVKSLARAGSDMRRRITITRGRAWTLLGTIGAGFGALVGWCAASSSISGLQAFGVLALFVAATIPTAWLRRDKLHPPGKHRGARS